MPTDFMHSPTDPNILTYTQQIEVEIRPPPKIPQELLIKKMKTRNIT